MSGHWSERLFESPIEASFTGWDDPGLSYDWDIMDVVRVAGQWYLVNESGCSCYGPGDHPAIEHGPDTLDGLRAHLTAEYPQDHYTAMRTAVLGAIDEASK